MKKPPIPILAKLFEVSVGHMIASCREQLEIIDKFEAGDQKQLQATLKTFRGQINRRLDQLSEYEN